MSSLTPYAFKDSLVRTRLDDDGRLWFVAKDLCAVLEPGNVTEALRNLDDDEKITLSNPESNTREGIPAGCLFPAPPMRRARRIYE